MCQKNLLSRLSRMTSPSESRLSNCSNSLGYRALGFASAEEFIAANADQSCDCIITDIHMTGISGFELKRLLASRGSTTPVIMITAQAEPSLEARAIACGALCLLRKPFEADTLIECLEKASNV